MRHSKISAPAAKIARNLTAVRNQPPCPVVRQCVSFHVGSAVSSPAQARLQTRLARLSTGPFGPVAKFSSTSKVAPGSKQHLTEAFNKAAAEGRPAYVTYLTAGFPTQEETVDCLEALAKGGADIIEIGVPFTDPLADGPVIQASNQAALDGGVTSLKQCLQLAREVRQRGVTTPFVLMGYYNPFLHYKSSTGLMADCRDAGISGFIIVDLPPEEAVTFRKEADKEGLSYIPLIAPTTTDDRIKKLVQVADSFIYAVSLTGVTGARTSLDSQLPEFIKRLRKYTDLPVAVGFGIGSNENYVTVGQFADGVVVGSAIVKHLQQNVQLPKGEKMAKLSEFTRDLAKLPAKRTLATTKKVESVIETMLAGDTSASTALEAARFGNWGGRYVPETLVEALDELEREYEKAKNDPEFLKAVRSYDDYIGRPSSLHLADRLTQHCGGAKIWLKREDLNHTGAHKINNAIAQALLALRIGKKRIIAETGAGQHGVATATICAKLGLELIVYMGSDDVKRQSLNVFRMEMLGAKVVAVDSGSRTLKDAINEAMRDWVTNIRTTHYLVGSAIGPHPFPTIVRDFQACIGSESREQMLKKAGKLPDVVVACVGGGSNAIGMFYPFTKDASVKLVGVEAGGEGVNTKAHSATLAAGTPGVLHGTRTYLLQDATTGQIGETHSISAGLDYPGVGPEHAFLKDTQRATYVPVTDREALLGFKSLTQLEGIIPALESSHAVYYAMELAKTMRPDQDVLICLSGRGDKDIDSVRKALPKFGCKLRMREQKDL